MHLYDYNNIATIYKRRRHRRRAVAPSTNNVTYSKYYYIGPLKNAFYERETTRVRPSPARTADITLLSWYNVSYIVYYYYHYIVVLLFVRSLRKPIVLHGRKAFLRVRVRLFQKENKKIEYQL